MKIIDYLKCGNVIRFYLGNVEDDDYWGDDWNDRPYEHNAGMVYDEHIKGYIEIAVTTDYVVLEPKDDWNNEGNSLVSKEDMKYRVCPCIVIVPISKYRQRWDIEDNYDKFASIGDNEVIRIYFEDDENKLINDKRLIMLEECIY